MSFLQKELDASLNPSAAALILSYDYRTAFPQPGKGKR